MTVRRPRLTHIKGAHIIGRTYLERNIFEHISAGASLVLEGDGGAGKNRLVAHYLLERSKDAVTIDIIGRSVPLFGGPHRVFGSALDFPGPPPGDAPRILWIDEANRHNLGFLRQKTREFDQILLTWSMTQGFRLPEWLIDELRPRALVTRLNQDMRADSINSGSIAARFGHAKLFEPVFAPLRRQPFIYSRAEADPLSTALAVIKTAVRYASVPRTILVLAHREETLLYLKEIAPQFPCPPIRTVTSAQMQGQDASIVIYPTAEEELDVDSPDGGLFDLEVLSRRARTKLHVIMQTRSLIAYAQTSFIHQPFEPEYSNFIDFIMNSGFAVEATGPTITLYDERTLGPSLLLITVDPAEEQQGRVEAARLAAAAFQRKIPAVVISRQKLRNRIFHPEDPAIARALAGAVRKDPHNLVAELEENPTILPDMRQRYQSKASAEKTKAAESIML